MERRRFVRNSAVLAGVASLISSTELINNVNHKECSIDTTTIFKSGKNVIINGTVLDAVTKVQIPATIVVRNGNGIFRRTRNAELNSGNFNLKGTYAEKVDNTLQVKVSAPGYKTFEGKLFLTKNGCRIHSDLWNYNPDFKPEMAPKNNISENEIASNFNFHLVKVS